MKVIIVDDERLARNALKTLLFEYSDMEVVGEASNGSEALELAEKYDPDVIFLDVQMPGKSGFDIISQLPEKSNIIFVTAFDQYAIRAFEVNALDYLLKPISPARLKQAINKLNRFIVEEINDLPQLKYDDKVLICLYNSMKLIEVNTIKMILADKNYTNIVTSENRFDLISKSLKDWEKRLPETKFIKIHRSLIINTDYIVKIEKWFNHSLKIYIQGENDAVVSSRRFTSRIRKKFEV